VRKIQVQLNLDTVLDEVYIWSSKQQFRGYNKHDGLNSPVLKYLLGWSKWSRILAIQGVMRFPVNLRPILLIPKSYNPKGLALFTQGLLNRYRHTNKKTHLNNSTDLLALLMQTTSSGNWSGKCWGYHYPWQDPGFYASTNTPNAVVTCFVCEAFLDAFRETNNDDYLTTVESAIRFLLTDLIKLKDTNDELCLSYMPLPMNMRVLDVSILIGAVVSQYCMLSGNKKYLGAADRLINYVVNQQTNYGAWYYTDPPHDSHIRHDNYHTGFILDALWRYMEATNNYQHKEAYWKGLEFYANSHFNEDGAPRWMSDKDFPHDIHGAAQGIITFSQHLDRYPGLSVRIANWSIKNMYNGEGRFYYQKNKWFKKRFTLLRWCNAWMALALSRLNLHLNRK
jgi:hypothetical protein